MRRLLLFLPLLLVITIAGYTKGEDSSELDAELHPSPIDQSKAQLSLQRDTREPKKKKKNDTRKPKKKKKNGRKKNNGARKKNGGARKKGKKSNNKNRRKKNKKAKKKKDGKRKKEKKRNKQKKKTKNHNIDDTNRQVISVCSGSNSVPEKCFLEAFDAMVFERVQITNLLKQTGRMTAQRRLLNNKMGKSNKFETPAQYLMKALGGNKTDPKCENSSSSAEEGMEDFETLMGCGKSINGSCDLGNAVDDAKTEDCLTTYKAIKESNKACIDENKEDAVTACACWKKVTAEITAAKTKECKKVSDMAIETNKARKKCVDTFKNCKKTEDHAIPMIDQCMTGEVKFMGHDDELHT